jgi:hypothetical protein
MLYLDGLVPREYWNAQYVDCCMDDGNILLVCWGSMEREDEYNMKYATSVLPNLCPTVRSTQLSFIKQGQYLGFAPSLRGMERLSMKI